MKKALIIGLLNLFSIGVFGQSAYTDAGSIVLDAETKEPLIGASVFVLENPKLGTITNISGAFLLDSVTTAHNLVISYIGYEEQTIPVRSLPQKIFLVSKSNVLTEITIIEKALVAEEFRLEELSQLDVYKNPISKADPILAVNALPASTTTDESANLSLRGSSPNETGTFINGVPIYDVTRFSQINGVGTLSIFNTAIVDRVEVFPSNPPLEFGNTSSGLVALETSEAIPDENRYGISLNLANLGVQTQQKLGEGAGLTVFGNFSPSFALKATNPTAFGELPYFRSADLGVQAVVKFPKSSLRIFSYALDERYQFDQQHPSGEINWEQTRRRNFNVLSYRRTQDQWTWETNAGLSFDRYRFGGGVLSLNNRQTDRYLATQVTYKGLSWSWKSGISWDERQGRFAGTAPQFSYALAEGFPQVDFEGDASVQVAEGFFYGKYYLNDRITLGGGLRKNLPTANVPSYWSGQMNLAWELSQKQKVILAAGQYHRAFLPRAVDLNLFRSRQLSLDHQYESSRWKVQHALFWKTNENSQYEEEILGFESFIAHTIPQKLQVSASFTFLDASRQQTNEHSRYASPFDLDYFVRLAVSYEPKPLWTLAATLLWRDGTFYAPLREVSFDERLAVYRPSFSPLSERERLADYANVSVNASKVFLLSEDFQMILYANMNNVLDRKNIREIGYTADYSKEQTAFFSRRTFFVGVELMF
ncbi:MAG: TonB-dependent receptor [Bacteroidota bacterium]